MAVICLFADRWLCDIPARYILAALGFSGCVVQYTLNVCLSVAIVAMVKPTQSASRHGIYLRTKENRTLAELEEVTVTCPSKDANGSYIYNFHNEVWYFLTAVSQLHQKEGTANWKGCGRKWP
jgi:hypothetical protein